MRVVSRWAACCVLALSLGVTGRSSAQTPAPSGSPYAEVGTTPSTQQYFGGSQHSPGAPCEAAGHSAEEEPPPPLTLANFFTAGWNEDFTRRKSEDRAPDLALLRVQTNFMEREVRVNYFFEPNIRSKTQAELNSFDY